MNKLFILLLFIQIFAIHRASCQKQPGKPNVIVFLADDMGYGDLQCYNSGSKVPTPNIDRLASEGLRFTDAHSPSSVCSPTRYAIMTGRYATRFGAESTSMPDIRYAGFPIIHMCNTDPYPPYMNEDLVESVPSFERYQKRTGFPSGQKNKNVA